MIIIQPFQNKSFVFLLITGLINLVFMLKLSAIESYSAQTASKPLLPSLFRWQEGYGEQDSSYPPHELKILPNAALPDEIRTEYSAFMALTPYYSPAFMESFFELVFQEPPFKVAVGDMAVHMRTKRDSSRESISYSKNGGGIHIYFPISRASSIEPMPTEEAGLILDELLASLPFNNLDLTRRYFSVTNNGISAKYFQKIDNLYVADCHFTFIANARGERESIQIFIPHLLKIADYPILTIEEAINEILEGRSRLTPEIDPFIPITGEIVEIRLFYTSMFSFPYVQPIYSFLVKRDDRIYGDEEIWFDVQAIRPEFIRAADRNSNDRK